MIEGLPKTEKVDPEIDAESSSETVLKLKRALIAAFVATLPANVEALEMTPKAKWLEGARVLMDTARTQPNEYAALFTQTKHFSRWQNVIRGTKNFAELDPDGEAKAARSHLADEVMQHPDSQMAIRVCRAHTHPNDARDGFAYAPSPTDINNYLQFVHEIDADFIKNGVSYESTGAVFAKHGVWYYSVDDMTITDITPDTTVAGVTLRQLLREQAEGADSGDQDRRWAGIGNLEGAYARLGIKIRFVPYALLKNEPPCAGPNYVPPAASVN